MPVRLKAIHVLNTISVIDQIMYLIKPFMNKELQKLVSSKFLSVSYICELCSDKRSSEF